MVEQVKQWIFFQNSMEHRHQEMLAHLRFSQVAEDHSNNQMYALS